MFCFACKLFPFKVRSISAAAKRFVHLVLSTGAALAMSSTTWELQVTTLTRKATTPFT